VPSILIVEDDVKMIDIIKRALEPLRCAVDTARNGDEALKRIGKNAYNLVITDLMMPRHTGFDLLDSLRNDGSKVPVLVCSAFVTPDALRGLGAGLKTEVVSKPFKPETILKSARRLLDLTATE
jgi:CheY-like chemotaxis protein